MSAYYWHPHACVHSRARDFFAWHTLARDATRSPVGHAAHHSYAALFDSARSLTDDERTVVLEKAFEATRYMGLQSTLATIVILFEGFGFSDMDPRLASQVLRILGDHYPERLRRVVLVDAPYIFQPVWKAVRIRSLPCFAAPTMLADAGRSKDCCQPRRATRLRSHHQGLDWPKHLKSTLIRQ